MKIVRSVTTHGSLAPAAWPMICALPESYCYHLEHGKRHPKSAYSRSLQAITDPWSTTLKLLQRVTIEHGGAATCPSYPSLLSEYRTFLYRLHEHHDACLGILRSLCRAVSASPAKFDSQWLKKAKVQPAIDFSDRTSDYREKHIGALVNAMKHDQCDLNSIFFHSAREFRPGYFLRDLLPDGALGPSGKLHSGGRTAFSFARDMMMHLWWLYRIGELLSEAISKIVPAFHGAELAPMSQPFQDPNLLTILAGVSDLKPRFFPDEIKKPYSRVALAKNHDQLTLEFPAVTHARFPGNVRISTSLTVDGNHPTNKLPYFGSEYEQWQRSL